VRTARSAFVMSIAWMLCSSLTALAQSNSAGAAATSTEAPSRQEQIATLTKEVQAYQNALLDPDIASDANRTSQTTELLITAKCNLEALELTPALTQDPKFVDGLVAACSERLHGQVQQPGVTNTAALPSPESNPSVKAPAISASVCSVKNQSQPSGSDTKYSYLLKCDDDAKPNSLAISMAQLKPALTAAQGDQFVSSFASALGTGPQSYDSTKAIAVFSLPAGASPYSHTFDVQPSNSATSNVTVDYYIAYGAATDATACSTNPANQGCSTGSIAVPISSGPLVAGTAVPPGGPVSILIGGVEYGGYSSEAQTTDAFLNIFYRGPVSKTGLAGWTRIRLTSAAQPATNGVVSVISNPTGLTTVNYANVGQVFDYSVGPSWNLPKTQYWALIASLGAITPLSSQNAPIVFVAPPPGTTECTTLLNRFSPKNGYNPGLTPNPAPNPTTCVVNGTNGVTNIAFTNQDRSNFLLKYSGGFRTWYPLGSCKTAAAASKCVPTYAAADFTLGQDSSITGGVLRGVVFKMDGLLPIPTGSSSWLYLFGSAYIRFRSNVNLPPLVLASPSSTVTVPSPAVAVLPLVQPNRDYYRLGVGVNINQLWCKVYASSCPTASQDSGTKSSAPSINLLNPSTAKAGSANDLKNLTVTGTNFTTDSKINWNGQELPGTTFVSATELTVTVPKANLAKATTVKVTVVNPSPSGASAAYEFKIQ
jgi:hypothetical protein